MKKKPPEYTEQTARKALEWHLGLFHANYTITDVVLSSARGYLKCTKFCRCTSVSPAVDVYFEEHFRTINIRSLYCNDKRKPYQLWDALKKFNVLKTEKEV